MMTFRSGRNSAPNGNILLVSNFPSDTAYAWWLMEQFWIALSNIWAEHGGKAYLAYPQVRTLSEPVATAPNLEVVELTVPGENIVQRAKTLQFIRENNIKTVYLTDRAWFSANHLLLRLAGAKTILIHDHTPGDRPTTLGWRRTIKSLRNRTPGLTADYVFCVSPFMRQRSIQNGCLPPERCLIVQNGITPLCRPYNRTTLRQRLNIPENAIVVMTTGRAHPYKRFDFVVRVAHELEKLAQTPDTHFLLVGDGPALADLTKLVIELGLEDRVHLLGYRPDVQQLLFAADIAMHAALGEGFSLSIVEYMSAGLPVLVPSIPSVSQAIDEKTGVIFPPNDAQAAATLLLDLAKNPSRTRALGEGARTKATELYSLDACLKSFQQQVKTILGTKIA